jgi:PIN domain nuclease of toxin-antitoxin system
MRIVLDAGALVAVDRGDRRVGAILKVAWERSTPVETSAGVVGQVWRGGPGQARLARTLAGVAVAALDLDGAKRAGTLLGRAGLPDVVDAHLALQVRAGDRVLTSDPQDLAALLDARRVEATIVRV